MALFSCPSCAWRVKIRDEDLGTKGKCLQCGQEFVIPSTLNSTVPVPEPVPAPPPSSAAGSLGWWKWGALAAVLALVPGIIWFGLALKDAPTPTVFGKVTYQSQPLSSGTVFLGDGYSQADIEKDGSYQILDAPSGPVKVSVRNVSRSLKKRGEKIEWVVKSLIPTKYNNPQTSGLQYIIGSGRQEINIDLKD